MHAVERSLPVALSQLVSWPRLFHGDAARRSAGPQLTARALKGHGHCACRFLSSQRGALVRSSYRVSCPPGLPWRTCPCPYLNGRTLSPWRYGLILALSWSCARSELSPPDALSWPISPGAYLLPRWYRWK